jgi:hypothetical protein
MSETEVLDEVVRSLEEARSAAQAVGDRAILYLIDMAIFQVRESADQRSRVEGIAGLAVAFSSAPGPVPAQECINVNGSAKTAPQRHRSC